MTESTRKRLDELKSHEYRKNRRAISKPSIPRSMNVREYVENFLKITEITRPIIHGSDDFGFCIGSSEIAWAWCGNVSLNYYRIATEGLDSTRARVEESMSHTSDEERLEYGRAMLTCIDRMIEMSDEHRELARSMGKMRLYDALGKVPRKGAETFYEACVFLRLCTYFARAGFGNHLGFGRFDQSMYPFFERDLARGVSREELFETLENFFISLNYDSDIYQGIQQGDNGQSMVLGGFDEQGRSMYNELSEMCLRASLELDLIDPKINLRVGKGTPDSLYELGTLLTRRGLGFPQYCNDDVVVPGLIKLGYEPADAYNYTVAACWEFIAPNCGADVPNIDLFDFPDIVNKVAREHLRSSESFDAFLAAFDSEAVLECERIREKRHGRLETMSPIMSLMTDGCIEALGDMWTNAKYRNFGCHGVGIANAADALAAIKLRVFDERSVSADELLAALDSNFENYAELRALLRSSPKMGDNDDYVDSLASHIMDVFSREMNGRDNGLGGVWRAGTGSAMEYVRRGEICGATADGRFAYDPYSSSFSPSLDVKNTGLLSIIQSFSKYNMENIINGGPLTLEIHDSVLRNDIGIGKVAALVKTFINLGGHQLQLNAVNRDKLLDAQKHPERYPGLIVRVWGWSGYFNELDVKYQNHIIRRTEHTV